MNSLEKIVKEMESFGADGLLVTSEVNRRYASGHPTGEGAVVITKEKSYYLTDSRYIEAATEGMPDFQVEKTGGKLADTVNGILKEHGVTRLGIEEEVVPVAAYREYEKAISARLADSSGLYKKLRAVKEPWEIEIMKQAQSIADKTFTELLKVIHPGMTERELAAEIICRLLKNGAEGISFDPIAVSGPNTSRPHGIPGERRLQKGDFITMDFGCRFSGYCSDMTRTVALGSVTDEMRRVYDVVLRAQLAGIAEAKAGAAGMQVDAEARRVISDAGYGGYFGHSFGHGLGLEVHETPNASLLNREPLPKGAVISAEPGVYMPGRFGVRIEDVVVLTDAGCENITFSPKELIVID